MHSTRKHLGREKNLEGECEKKDLTLNLAVCGSPVPVYAQPPKTFREYKICKPVPKKLKKKTFSFPVDKIIYLTEKLELTSLTEKEIKSVSLSGVKIKAKNCLEKLEKEILHPRDNEAKQDNFSKDLSPPGHDFSLDLSSIVNTGEDSNESCNESEETVFHFGGEPASASPSEEKLYETSQVANCSNQIFFESKEDLACAFYDESDRAKIRSCDLINVYVNSVNNQKELVRFFRPCHACKEPCCICPDSSFRSHPCFEMQSMSHFLENARTSCCTFGKLDETDKTNSSCECINCPVLKKRFCCTEFCGGNNFEADFYSFCGKINRCKTGRVSQNISDDSLDPDKKVAYTSSLANAAKSARNLARDLELIMSTLKSEDE